MKIILVLIVLACCATNHGQSTPSVSGNGGGVAEQYCGVNNTEYYCPSDGLCKSRSQRCTDNERCTYGDSNTNNGCFQNSVSGLYSVQLGHANLFGSIQSTRDYYPSIEHQFIQYRGFTYEFGKSYGVQILDINDQGYKYLNNKSINSKGITTQGYSSCTWEQATLFTRMWKKEDYNLIYNNCQKFASTLQLFLTNGSCSHHQLSYSRLEDQRNRLEQEIDALLTNCSVICCDGNSPTSGSSVFKYGSDVYAILTAVLYSIVV